MDPETIVITPFFLARKIPGFAWSFQSPHLELIYIGPPWRRHPNITYEWSKLPQRAATIRTYELRSRRINQPDMDPIIGKRHGTWCSYIFPWQFLVTFLWWLSDPLKGESWPPTFRNQKVSAWIAGRYLHLPLEINQISSHVGRYTIQGSYGDGFWFPNLIVVYRIELPVNYRVHLWILKSWRCFHNKRCDSELCRLNGFLICTDMGGS